MKSLQNLDNLKLISRPQFFEELKNEFWTRFLMYNTYPNDTFKWDERDTYTIDYASKQSNETSYTESLSVNLSNKIRSLFENLRRSLIEDRINISNETKEKRLIDVIISDLEGMRAEFDSRNTPQLYSKIIEKELIAGIELIKKLKPDTKVSSKKSKGSILLDKIDTDNNEKFRSFYSALTDGEYIPKNSSAQLRRVFTGANLSEQSPDLKIEWLKKATEAKYLFQKLSDKKVFPHIKMKNKWIAVTNNFKVLNESGIELDSESIRVVGDIPEKQKERKKELNSILDILRN